MSKFTLLQHRKLKDVIPVPQGLPELMADIAREVVRFQPANVERFIADYLESMLISREMIYVSQKTMHDVFDTSLQIAEIMKKEGVALEKVEIGVKIIREECETSFNESKFNRKMRIINRLTNECKLEETRARKIVNNVEDLMAHHRMRNSCCSSHLPQPIHLEAVKNTFNFHFRLNSLAKTPDILQDVVDNIAVVDEKNANWKSENFSKREEAAIKIQRWSRSSKLRKRKSVKFEIND